MTVKDIQAEVLFSQLESAQPGIITKDRLCDEVAIVNAWMIMLTLKDRSDQIISNLEREQIQILLSKGNEKGKENFSKRLYEYETLDNRNIGFAQVHETEFDKHAQLFLRHCITNDTPTVIPTQDIIGQCVQYIAIFIKYWLITYLSYGSEESVRTG